MKLCEVIMLLMIPSVSWAELLYTRMNENLFYFYIRETNTRLTFLLKFTGLTSAHPWLSSTLWLLLNAVNASSVDGSWWKVSWVVGHARMTHETSEPMTVVVLNMPLGQMGIRFRAPWFTSQIVERLEVVCYMQLDKVFKVSELRQGVTHRQRRLGHQELLYLQRNLLATEYKYSKILSNTPIPTTHTPHHRPGPTPTGIPGLD